MVFLQKFRCIRYDFITVEANLIRIKQKKTSKLQIKDCAANLSPTGGSRSLKGGNAERVSMYVMVNVASFEI